MHQNIKNNSIKKIDAKLYNGNYYDFMLYNGEVMSQNLSAINEMALFDFSDLNIVDGVLYSTVKWSGATNNGVELKDIGFTGMDNGLISFKKDRITNSEFVELLTNSKYNIEADDTRLFLTPVTGNTQMYDYPLFLYNDGNEKYIVCNGGFYQGFFMLHGHEYKVLPHKLDNEWVMHFNIRPRTDYDIPDNTVNYTHKDNEGIFFFMGLRAENKFWPFYKTDKDIIKTFSKQNAQIEGYFDGCNDEGEIYNINKNNVVSLENDWVANELPEDNFYDSYFAVGDSYFACDFNASSKMEYVKPNNETRILSNGIYSCNVNEKICECDNYFKNDYYDNKCVSSLTKFVADEYIGKGVVISENDYKDSDGHGMAEYGFEETLTDNKFLLFDRTKNGFTIDTWKEGTKLMLTRRQQWPNHNYFLLMNRTNTGYTIDTIDKYNEENEYDYSIHNDIKGNVFALRIKKDGSIGYRYGVSDCNSDTKYSVIEEYSKPNIIKNNEWNNINVKYSLLGGERQEYDSRERKMKIYIYVNGFLVFISKEIDAFVFRPIEKECSSKQETVPYNISLGGGTLGLLESILPNYYAISDYILPIEKDFCGTFIGDIKSFKMYNGEIDYSTIVNYLS